MSLNQNEELRDEIIFGEHDNSKYSGGIRRYEGLDLNKLNALIEGEFVELEDAQNSAPTIEEMREFMTKWKDYNVTANGYVVEKRRSDYRTSIEGLDALTIDSKPFPDELVEDFTDMFRQADSFKAAKTVLHCWYD